MTVIFRQPSDAPASPAATATGAIAPRPAALLLATACLVLAGCKTEIARAPEVRPVEVVRAAYADAARLLVYAGDVRPRREQALGFRIAGKIIARHVEVGDRVLPGTVLAELDATDQRLAEATARAELAAAEATAAQTRAELERARRLVQRKVASVAEYDARELAAKTAEAQVAAASARLDQARNQTGYAKLVADRAGVVTAIPGEVGTVVEIGEPVVHLALSDEKEIRLTVPEQEVALLERAAAVRVAFWALPGVELDGTVREIAAAADPQSRTFAVRVAITGAPAAVRLGMSASVTVRVPAAEPSLVLPLAAVDQRQGQTVVWVVDTARGVVATRPVTIGGLVGNAFAITDGLRAGEPVVAAGGALLHEGQAVVVTGETTALAEAMP